MSLLFSEAKRLLIFALPLVQTCPVLADGHICRIGCSRGTEDEVLETGESLHASKAQKALTCGCFARGHKTVVSHAMARRCMKTKNPDQGGALFLLPRALWFFGLEQGTQRTNLPNHSTCPSHHFCRMYVPYRKLFNPHPQKK